MNKKNYFSDNDLDITVKLESKIRNMKYFKICDSDPILEFVRKNYNANPLKVPDDRVQPLSIIASNKETHKFIGVLSSILSSKDLKIDVKESNLVDLSSIQTSKLNIDTGFSLLQGFLGSIPSGNFITSLKGSLTSNRVSSISFFFPDPKRNYIDLSALASKLKNYRIETSPLTGIFLRENQPFDLLLIDSVITSSGIGIAIQSKTESKLKLSGDIDQLASNAGINLDSNQDTNLVITSKSRLPFAFSCVGVLFAKNGEITGIEPEYNVNYKGAFEAHNLIPPKHYFVTEGNQLIELD